MAQDHPRIRGKHGEGSLFPTAQIGSPPHTRETPLLTTFLTDPGRITPAYAGNTISYSVFNGSYRDHPRIRGKHYISLTCCQVDAGSPPHTRETLLLYFLSFGCIGITPAYAGNTFLYSVMKGAWGDHPRIRGKHKNYNKKIIEVRGSPPHTRETHITAQLLQQGGRITPAYAGNTRWRE